MKNRRYTSINIALLCQLFLTKINFTDSCKHKLAHIICTDLKYRAQNQPIPQNKRTLSTISNVLKMKQQVTNWWKKEKLLSELKWESAKHNKTKYKTGKNLTFKENKFFILWSPSTTNIPLIIYMRRYV